MPTPKLCASDIINYRRSSPQYDQIALKVAFTTPKAKLDQLCEKLNSFVQSERVDFIKKVGINLDSFVDLESAIIKISYCHRTNWQNHEMFVTRRAKFNRALIMKLKEVGIVWTPLPRPVELEQSLHQPGTSGNTLKKEEQLLVPSILCDVEAS